MKYGNLGGIMYYKYLQSILPRLHLHKIIISGTLVAGTFSSANAFDINFTGWLDDFSKLGFNNKAIAPTEQYQDAINAGDYPTDSFVNVVGNIGLKGNILSNELENHKLTYWASIAGGGMVFDSTSKDYPLGPDSVNNEYLGIWAGYDGRHNGSTERHLYVINNAHLDYTYGNASSPTSFQFKGGRYASKAEYMSGYTQGFEFMTKLNFAKEENAFHSLKLWWFSSYGRAFAEGMWVMDFMSPRGYFTEAGRFANYGIHAFKLTYEIGMLDIAPIIYFSPGTYTAPMLQIRLDSNKAFQEEGFRSQTFIHFMNPLHNDRVINEYRYGDLAGHSTQTLYINQRFDINNYHFGVALYKNFGNANAYIGTTGNPVLALYDFWSAASYDLGRSISDMIGKDAITPMLFVGGAHFDGKLNWRLVGRYTDSSRSREQSVGLSLTYQVTEKLLLGGKIEYYNDITKAGYRVGSNGPRQDANGPYVPTTNSQETPQNIADRSHAFLFLSYQI